jgi:hypothetical protein
MKLIRINESQKRRLFEAYSERFSLEELTKIGNEQPDGNAQYEYCVRHLGEPDAAGSSRAVFTFSDNTVLKLAYGKREAGIDQNRSEVELFRETKSPLLVRIYACDEQNYTWMISEAVLPARPEDFEYIFGVPFGKEYKQNTRKMMRLALPDKGDNDIGFNEYFDNIKEPNEEYKNVNIRDALRYIIDKYYHKNTIFTNPIVKNIVDNGYLSPKLKEWVNEFIKLVKDHSVSDIVKDERYVSYEQQWENFGIVNRGNGPQLVILDSGANKDVIAKHYR